MFDLPVPDSRRMAALALHGLTPEDRAWVLDRLDTVDRDSLQRLIDELVALGVPADPELTKAAAQVPGMPICADDATPVPEASPALAAVGAALAQEHDEILALCLGAYDDAELPWLLQSLPERRGHVLRRRLPREAKALREAIRAIAAERARLARAQEIRLD